MKWFALLIGSFLMMQGIEALNNFEEIYPPSCQTFEESYLFRGDRHGDFLGDDVAILSDRSAWKIHPKSSSIFHNWLYGDKVRLTVCTDRYWFKREHKFALYNYSTNQYSNVMLVGRQAEPLTIVRVQPYAKSMMAIYMLHTTYHTDDHGQTYSMTDDYFSHYADADFRKIIWLSDGSEWVIKEKLGEYQVGMRVYVGAQGVKEKFYDFILIVGDQREAIWTWARSQK